MIQRVVYITTARLPTEKAHGFQIAKMCEALGQHGIDVTLVRPHRYQYDANMAGQSIFEYYSIAPIFRVRTLRNVDLVPLNQWIPDRVCAPIFVAHSLLWGLYAALVARAQQADLYYTRETEVAFWLLQLGLSTVYEAHVVPRRVQRLLLKRMAGRRSLRLVAVLTPFIKERLIQLGFRRERIVVAPDAVDLTLFENLPDQPECRRRLGLPLDRQVVGYVGRFRAMGGEKGVPELIQAMAWIRASGSPAPLLLCVGGPMDIVPRYREIAREAGVPEDSLWFVDRVQSKDVPRWIRACDVVTIPWTWTEFSAYFTSPLKLFEYMAAEVPIVATDLPALREILQHDRNGWLVAPGHAQALAEGLQTILADQAKGKRLACTARSDVQRYTWHSRARAILDAANEFSTRS